MRGVVAVLLLASLAAGCLGSDDTPQVDEAPVAAAGIFIARDGGIDPAGDLPGMSIDSDENGTLYHLQLRSRVLLDSFHLVLVQALERTEIDIEHSLEFLYTPSHVPSEGRAPADFCLLHYYEQDPAADAFLERAQGRDAPIPDVDDLDRLASYTYYQAPRSPLAAGYGISNGFSLGGHLATGDWLLFGQGQSGVPEPDFHVESNYWNLTIAADQPMRIILLPEAPLRCGSGMNRFEGVSGGDGLAVGGRADIQGRYGLTTAFEDDELLGPISVPSLALDGATLLFGETSIPLRDLSDEWHDTYRPDAGAIVNDRWTGYPDYFLAGFAVPTYPELVLQSEGGLDVIEAKSPALALA